MYHVKMSAIMAKCSGILIATVWTGLWIEAYHNLHCNEKRTEMYKFFNLVVNLHILYP